MEEYGVQRILTICRRNMVTRRKKMSFKNGGGSGHKNHRHSLMKTILAIACTGIACIFLNASHYRPSQLLLKSSHSFSSGHTRRFDPLEKVLRSAAMEDGRTVIITTLNAAWTEPGSIFDLFLESFRIGNQTRGLLKHLVVVALDHKAYTRCMEIHSHCYRLTSRGVDFSQDANFRPSIYRKMMWMRINFLLSVLEIGYDFIFTDADILWLRNPFPRFLESGDLQFACDSYKHSSTSLKNGINGGFSYAKSNNRTIQFYRFWYDSRNSFPGLNEQVVFDAIKFGPFIPRIGLEIRFLDTAYFGGFCEPKMDLDLVVTMHANCCVGLRKKINDMKMVMEDWNKYAHSVKKRGRWRKTRSWTGPRKCGLKS